MDERLISLNAAIETVRKAKSIGQAHRMLIQLPSAQPGWIPVTERLPEESDEYLVTIKGWKGKFTIFLTYSAEYKEWLDEKACRWTVLAWQPKPKPWEGGQDNG